MRSRILVVSDPKVNAFEIRHGQAESVSHFLALHAVAKIENHLKAEQAHKTEAFGSRFVQLMLK